MKFFKFLLFFVLSVEGTVHVCQHHQSEDDSVTVPIQRAKTTKATDDAYQPIRFGKHVFDMKSVAPEVKIILDRLFTETIEWISSYLKVIPAANPIKVSSTSIDGNKVPSEHNNPGISNIDYMIYFMEDDCSAIANAGFLQSDVNYQPYVGRVHICKNLIDVSNELYYKTVLLHEITHALGFSNTIFEKMKDSTTSKKYLNTKTTSDGVTRNILSTPKVTSFLKDHFGCNSLEGAYIENDGGSGTAGSHWESTSYNSELMTGWISSSKINILTNLTLNWLEDTGWYKVDYSAANKWIFGYKKGCEMAELECSKTVDGEEVANGDYCIENQKKKGCNVDYSAIGVCMKQLGNDCPTIVPYSNGLCKNISNSNPENDLAYGKIFSSTSYCHYNHLLLNGYTGSDIVSSCLKTKCNSNDNSYSLVICNNRYGCSSEDEYISVKCKRAGEVVDVEGFKGNVTCIDPNIVCTSGLDEDDDDDNDYTGSDKPSVTPKPITPRPITSRPNTETPEPTGLNNKSSDYVFSVIIMLFIILLII